MIGGCEPLDIGIGLPESTGMLIALAVAAAMLFALYRWAANSARRIDAV